MNRYWLFFLAFVSMVACWHTAKAGNGLYTFYTLSSRINVTAMKITTHEFSNERFGADAHYQFIVGDNLFENSEVLDEPIFRNRQAMENDIPRLEEQKWSVWFQPSNPKNSALSITFPFKEVIYSIILWGLLFYFVWLGYYTK